MKSSLPPYFEGVTVPAATLPAGYIYNAAGYADVILRNAFSEHWQDLLSILESFRLNLEADILRVHNNPTPATVHLRRAFGHRGWGREYMDVETRVNRQVVTNVRGLEMDVFKRGPGDLFPGVAVQIEWSGKEQSFDRDLSNFNALQRAEALAAAIIITRGPSLQHAISAACSPRGLSALYGPRTTHWDNLKPRVEAGGNGACPLLVIGVEPERVQGL